MNKVLKKLLKFFFFFIIPISFIVTLVICFFAFKKLVFPVDIILPNGKKVSHLAAEIRSELVKRKDVKDVTFRSKDGLKLTGYFIKRRKPVANLLVCHGYQGCKEFAGKIIDMFPDYNILLFDFRAHGKSEGKFRSIGCFEHRDVIAASEYLKELTKPQKKFIKPLPFVILGFSMGAAVAIEATAIRKDICDVLIIDSSYANLDDVIAYAFTAKSGLPKYPFLPILRQLFSFIVHCDTSKVKPVEKVCKIDKPILFIHSCVDDIVSPLDSLQMYANCLSENKKLWIAPACKHARLHLYHTELYKRKIKKFLKIAINC